MPLPHHFRNPPSSTPTNQKKSPNKNSATLRKVAASLRPKSANLSVLLANHENQKNN
jgi:hypothetical protein